MRERMVDSQLFESWNWRSTASKLKKEIVIQIWDFQSGTSVSSFKGINRNQKDYFYAVKVSGLKIARIRQIKWTLSSAIRSKFSVPKHWLHSLFFETVTSVTGICLGKRHTAAEAEWPGWRLVHVPRRHDRIGWIFIAFVWFQQKDENKSL